MKYFGILNIDKPKGLTSHDVVARLRKILGIKQVGHTGTLDPIATGVLPVCIGKATKVIQYLDSDKAYRAYIRLGVRTNTYDTEGEIIEKNPVILDLDEIKNYLNDFLGNIKQKPPMFSAVHYKGKRLYEYARQNIEIEEIPERDVTVKHIELMEVLEQDTDNPLIIVDVECSSGTYIRSIINDLGNKLGYGACMEGLIRTGACGFKITDSYTIDKIKQLVEDNEIENAVINPLAVVGVKSILIDDVKLDKIKKGQYFEIADVDFSDDERVKLEYQGRLSAIAKIKDGKVCPVNVFD